MLKLFIYLFFLQEFQLEKLKHLNLRGCKFITKLPELCTPNLETLDLSDCENLVQIHKSGAFLHKLKTWKLNYCEKLQNLPNNLMLTSLEVLEELNLLGCKNLRDLPDGIYKLQQLRCLWIPTAKLRPTSHAILLIAPTVMGFWIWHTWVSGTVKA